MAISLDGTLFLPVSEWQCLSLWPMQNENGSKPKKKSILIWPKFMKHTGPIFGMPFSLEGTAFFIEAIALGVFLYGWDKLSPRMHWWSGIVISISGVFRGSSLSLLMTG